MKLNVYVIYDSKAKVYNRPFYLLNDDIASRTASDLVTDKTNDLGRHPEDFIMFRLGSFDDQTAEFVLEPAPVVLFRFHEIQGALNV